MGERAGGSPRGSSAPAKHGVALEEEGSARAGRECTTRGRSSAGGARTQPARALFGWAEKEKGERAGGRPKAERGGNRPGSEKEKEKDEELILIEKFEFDFRLGSNQLEFPEF